MQIEILVKTTAVVFVLLIFEELNLPTKNMKITGPSICPCQGRFGIRIAKKKVGSKAPAVKTEKKSSRSGPAVASLF
jgi:hypothetical protein